MQRGRPAAGSFGAGSGTVGALPGLNRRPADDSAGALWVRGADVGEAEQVTGDVQSLGDSGDQLDVGQSGGAAFDRRDMGLGQIDHCAQGLL